MPCYMQVRAKSPDDSSVSPIVLLDVHNCLRKYAIDAPTGTEDFLRILIFTEILYNISITPWSCLLPTKVVIANQFKNRDVAYDPIGPVFPSARHGV